MSLRLLIAITLLAVLPIGAAPTPGGKPEKAAELLESVNYLADAGHCFVVLGVARDIVEAQVASAQKMLAEEQAAMERAGRNEPVTVSATQAPQADKIGSTMHVNTCASSSSSM